MSKNKKISESENNLIEPRFSIRSIDLLNFTLAPYQGEMATQFNFDVEVNQLTDLANKVFASKISLSIKDGKGMPSGNLSLSCTFEVENLNEINAHKPSLESLGLKLNQITISTARGVMFGLFRGTFLHNAVLPIVDVTAFQTITKV